MTIRYLRKLTGRNRNRLSNVRLARFLAFIAGAANAGGYLAVQQYTSHMSGIISGLADNLALGQFMLALAGLFSLLAFVAGAANTAWVVNWARRKGLHSEYALPLFFEAVLLLIFGFLGGYLEHKTWFVTPMTVMLLCFMMGQQNALITKVSKSEIRTTHVTGMVTDIGIELGKLFYLNRPHPNPAEPRVLANRDKLRLLSSMVGLFFIGGLAGAIGFKHLGFVMTVPLAVLLLLLAIVPVMDDLQHLARDGHLPHA